MATHSVQLLLGKLAIEGVYLCTAHCGALAPAQQLYALGSGVCTLVKLTGQCFYREYGSRTGKVYLLSADVHRGLGKNSGLGIVKQILINALHIIAVEYPYGGKAGYAQESAALVQKA